MRGGQPRTYRWLSAHRRKKLMNLSSLIDLVDLSWLSLLLFCLAVLGAAILRGFSGFGFALAAVPLASLIVAPTKAVAIAVLLQATVGVRDVIKGRSLTLLNIDGTAVSDLSPLAGMPLRHLYFQNTKVVDAMPLLQCPSLETIVLPRGIQNVAVLRLLPKLRNISFSCDRNGEPAETAAEFWKALVTQKEEKP
jgi:hypothetical protein